jgi:peptidoglycan/LPS O-acetylase OafA/YrhL
MVFPFLVVFIYRKKMLAVILLALFAITAYIAIMFLLPRHDPFDPKVVVPHNLDVSFDYGYLRGIAGFILGMLVYKMYEAGRFRKIFQRDITAAIVILGTVFCLHLGLNDGFYIILFMLVVFVFAVNEGKLHAACNNRVAQYLGKVSYSIYLIQLFPSFFIRFKLPGVEYSGYSASAGFWTGLGYCISYVFIVVGFASLTYFGIEKPCRKFINRKWGKETMPVYA